MSEFRSGMVAVVGRPNAGKSTLVNRLVGEKVAIVSDKPQTTRRRILGIVHRPEFQLALIDTPGIHRPEHRMNRIMVRDAIDSMEGADAVLFVVDVAEDRGPGERFISDLLSQAGRPPVVVALNKIDRIARTRLLPLLATFHERLPGADLVPVSALKGDGTGELLGVLARRLPEGPPLFSADEKAPGDLAEKISEQIREPALELLREELPFALAVAIESIEKKEDTGMTVVKAMLLVERASQKGIVIGEQGSMIRSIGTSARERCEARFGGKFYLDLRVATRDSWREDDRVLARVVNPEVLRETR